MCSGQGPPQGPQLEQSNPFCSHELATVSEQASTTPHCRQTHVRHHSHTNLHEQTSHPGTATCCSVSALLLPRKRSRALEENSCAPADCMAHLSDCNELTELSPCQPRKPKPYSSALTSCLTECICLNKHLGIYKHRDYDLNRSSTTALLALAPVACIRIKSTYGIARGVPARLVGDNVQPLVLQVRLQEGDVICVAHGTADLQVYASDTP